MGDFDGYYKAGLLGLGGWRLMLRFGLRRGRLARWNFSVAATAGVLMETA
ncbi:MAG: hypothetical protein ACI8RU_000130 [Zhongshania aliphaticivorans]|jgi:hypothetical protein